MNQFISLLFLLLTLSLVSAVNWNGNNWALGCDFKGGDFANVQVSGNNCGGKCAATSGCTHFTWTSHNGGTCWMKNGAVTQADAFDISDKSSVCGVITATSGVNWNGNNWAIGCDFKGGDFTSASCASSECGGKCASTSGCTHFTWTSYNGGTCWMKNGQVSQGDAFAIGDNSAVCGIVTSSSDPPGPPPPPPSEDVVGPFLQNVLATRHVNGGGDACALPKTSYAVNTPFALGDIPALSYLKFRPELCGHVLRINCGNGPLDIIITNSNYGGGIDLYSQTTWPTATNNKPPGQAYCSVQLTTRNPLNGAGFQCFYKPGTGTTNLYYRNVGMLNTNEKIVTKATTGGQAGVHRGDNIYYAFDLGRPIQPSEQVVFTFNDGSTKTVRFSDCVDVGSEQYWQ